jgi:molybdate transport system substrate-binding protein
MTAPLHVLSSMATKAVLAELAQAYEASSEERVVVESVGGVDAKKRVQAGETFDAVVLSGEAIDDLLHGGHLVAGSKTDLVTSGVAVAVRAGAPRPAIDTEANLVSAVLAAQSIGFSTGPSGVKLAHLLERWGIAGAVRDRIVTPPPGVPVGALVARGEVELGFQQLSELIHLEGIELVGPLPAAIQIVTTFSAAVGARSRRPAAARALLAYFCSDGAAAAKRRQGMDPA